MEYAPAGTTFTPLPAAKYDGVWPICTNHAFLYRYKASCWEAFAEAAAEPPSTVFHKLSRAGVLSCCGFQIPSGLISRPGLGMESPQTNPVSFAAKTSGTLFSSRTGAKLILTPMAAKSCCTAGWYCGNHRVGTEPMLNPCGYPALASNCLAFAGSYV